MPYKIIYTKEATDFIQKEKFSLKIHLDLLINKIINHYNKDLETLVIVDLYRDSEGWMKLTVTTKTKGKCFHEHLEDSNKLFKEGETNIALQNILSEVIISYDDSYEDRFNCKNGRKEFDRKQTICHLFIKEGKIEYLSDCTHSLAGTTIDLPDWK